jgi:hypothetical protein
MPDLPEYVDGLPNIAGHETEIQAAMAAAANTEVFRPAGAVDFANIKAAFAIALHQHQPLIPAGGHDLHSAEVISNLKHMWDNQGIGDNHNAPVFAWCYKRIGEFVPQLFHEGKHPRVMLEYSGTLLHGLRHMGQHDVVDALKGVTCNPEFWNGVEWLGCPWGHAVAPSTPVQDYRLHVQAFLHHFAAIFGTRALERVRGFSPSEMALPNHPDVAYAFVKTLKDCGFQWVLVQEHTIEQPASGHGPERKHLPHRLVCRNSTGESEEIICLIKTQGSDTKLVAQMQPFYEAKALDRWMLAGKSVPPLVTQIADGENGGVMMNEFPASSWRRCARLRLVDGADERHRVPGVPVRVGHQAVGPAGGAADPSESDLGPDAARRWPRETGDGHRGLQEERPPLPHGRRQLDQQHLLGQRLRRRAERHGALQLAVLRKGAEAEGADRRDALSQRLVPPALLADQLLPLLGSGRLDGLRAGAVSPHRLDPQQRLRVTGPAAPAAAAG